MTGAARVTSLQEELAQREIGFWSMMVRGGGLHYNGGVGARAGGMKCWCGLVNSTWGILLQCKVKYILRNWEKPCKDSCSSLQVNIGPCL